MILLTQSKQSYFLLLFAIPFLQTTVDKFWKYWAISTPIVLIVLNLLLPNAFENIVNFSIDYASFQNSHMGYLIKIRNFIHFPFSNISFALVPFFFLAILLILPRINSIYKIVRSNQELTNFLIISFVIYLSIFSSSIWQQHRMAFAPFVSLSIFIFLYSFKKFVSNKIIVLYSLFLFLFLFPTSIYKNYAFVVNNKYWEHEVRIRKEVKNKLIEEIASQKVKRILVMGKMFPDLPLITNTSPATMNFQYDHIPIIRSSPEIQQRLFGQIKNEEIDMVLIFEQQDYFNLKFKRNFYAYLKDRYIKYKEIDKFTIYLKK